MLNIISYWPDFYDSNVVPNISCFAAFSCIFKS
ncbi:hypothetical protein Ark11_0876 [Candidatus Ichthyocystis hellenicum]|uniref:Uncharacterized protein n=1 Tax=Candidatus Ichthyocystis hellenicum TaxID=1561003 RepID=A0A0S4M1P5_9BURK|nr:hypothetical protein Ark11_0876 [Candidatus Ichthyocystis hellenicum]